MPRTRGALPSAGAFSHVRRGDGVLSHTAHSWDQLAAEIEGAQAFIRTMAEIVGREPERTGRAEPEAA